MGRKSMFGLLKKKNPHEQNAYEMYAQVMEQSRKPEFYNDFSVPDTFDGRFEVLIVHAFILIEVLNKKDIAGAEAFNQALFDRIFVQMKITLREIGVGDVGIPKHMQKMMKALNGRLHAYSAAYNAEGEAPETLVDALLRNLYGTVDSPDPKVAEKFSGYIHESIAQLDEKSFDEIITNPSLFEFKI